MRQSQSSKRSRVIEALLTTTTIDQAAIESGVARSTVYRWLDDPQFQERLHAAESRSIDRAARRLVYLSSKALAALESILDNPTQDGAANRRMAATAILDSLFRARESKTTEERLGALEALAREKFGKKTR